MKIKVKGEHSLAGIKQALFEKLFEIEERFGVRFTLDATLYIRPSNGFGADVVPRFLNGGPVKCLYSNGPYRSIGEDYSV